MRDLSTVCGRTAVTAEQELEFSPSLILLLPAALFRIRVNPARSA
jgi:hypothetical protein